VGLRIKILMKDTYGMTQMEYGLVRFCNTSRREERSGKKLKRKDYGKKEEI
jgi:hypothetical protein